MYNPHILPLTLNLNRWLFMVVSKEGSTCYQSTGLPRKDSTFSDNLKLLKSRKVEGAWVLIFISMAIVDVHYTYCNVDSVSELWK